MTRPRNLVPALCNSITAIGTIDRLWANPAATNMVRPSQGFGIQTNPNTSRYQTTAKIIIIRAGCNRRPVMLTTTDPDRAPNAKLATNVPSPACPRW